jgi:hypothetical protein
MLSKSIKITTTGERIVSGDVPKQSRQSKDTKVAIPLEIHITSIERNSTWVVLDSLWQDYVEKWRRTLDPKGKGDSSQNRISKNMAQVEKDVQKGKFYAEFQVTDSPNANTTFTCLLWISSTYVLGTLYITDNFLCFRTSDLAETYRLVVAWINITRLEPTNSLMGLADNAIKLQTRYGNEFTFCVPQNRDDMWLLMQRTWTGRLFYKERMLKNFSTTMVVSPNLSPRTSSEEEDEEGLTKEEKRIREERRQAKAAEREARAKEKEEKEKEGKDEEKAGEEGKDKEKEREGKYEEKEKISLDIKKKTSSTLLPDSRIPASTKKSPRNFNFDYADEISTAWALDPDITSVPRFQESEKSRLEVWNEYFKMYGVMMEPIITQRFADILVDNGLPRTFY